MRLNAKGLWWFSTVVFMLAFTVDEYSGKTEKLMRCVPGGYEYVELECSKHETRTSKELRNGVQNLMEGAIGELVKAQNSENAQQLQPPGDELSKVGNLKDESELQLVTDKMGEDPDGDTKALQRKTALCCCDTDESPQSTTAILVLIEYKESMIKTDFKRLVKSIRSIKEVIVDYMEEDNLIWGVSGKLNNVEVGLYLHPHPIKLGVLNLQAQVIKAQFSDDTHTESFSKAKEKKKKLPGILRHHMRETWVPLECKALEHRLQEQRRQAKEGNDNAGGTVDVMGPLKDLIQHILETMCSAALQKFPNKNPIHVHCYRFDIDITEPDLACKEPESH